MSVEVAPFGVLPDGTVVDAIHLSSATLSVTVLTYGATLASIRVPDTDGNVADVALGFDDLEGWLHDPQYFGSVVGRFANRIRRGRFPLDGRTVQVTPNRGDHHLHGGARGFDKAVWSADIVEGNGAVAARLRHRSPDGDEGYPGALDVTVVYELAADTLTIRYEATTDAPTLVNLTNHVYLNLAGGGDVLDHIVKLNAAAFLPIDDETLPTGEIRSVAGTPMDLRSPVRIGDAVSADAEQVRRARGFDHCWVVGGTAGALRACATVVGGGRRLDVATTQPGVQFYTGQGIRPRAGRNGSSYGPNAGFCLETQHFPDSPNHDHFPSTRRGPDDRYAETTRFRFGPA